MTVLAVEHLTKSFAEKVVLKDVSFRIHAGERVGLVGANGAGKSTLLHLITSDLDADAGRIRIAEPMEIGYLKQTFDGMLEWTVHEWLENVVKPLRDMERRMQELALNMETVTGNTLAAVMQEYGEVAHKFELRGGYALEHRTNQVLHGLGLADLDGARKLASLSGGEKRRLGLAGLLMGMPDLLLLDEPTNHLDFTTMAWLEQYLLDYRGACLVISHDRQFLNACTSRILELDEYTHQLRDYSGNYDAYLEQKRIEREQWEMKYQAQQEEIRLLQQRLRDAGKNIGHNRPPKDNNKMAYNGHGASVQQATARDKRAAEMRLQRIHADPVLTPPQPLEFRPVLGRGESYHSVAVSLSDVSVLGYDGTPILANIRFTLSRTDKVLIVGPNGAGKTTLLSVIAARLVPDQGERFVPASLAIGYLPQEVNPNAYTGTLLDAFRQGLTEGTRDEHVARLLSLQLFRYDEFELSVSSLSPGQLRKLALARLLSRDIGLLLVDEPSNHLSFDVLEEFERAIQQFSGPVIAVSHDRWFIDRFQGLRYTLLDGRLQENAESHSSTEELNAMVAEIQELSQYPVQRVGSTRLMK